MVQTPAPMVRPSMNRIRLRHSRSHIGLDVLLVLLVVGITFGGILVSFLLQLTFERQQIIASAKANALNTSLTIQASIDDAMLQNRPESIARAFATIVGVGVANRVRILAMDGTIWRSSDASEAGQRRSPEAAECQECHERPETAPDRIAVALVSHGQEAVAGTTLIHNRSECFGCHDPRQAVLGHVMTENPLAESANLLQIGFWKIALTVIVTFALLVGLMIPTLRTLIVRPLLEMSKAAAEMGVGNLGYRFRTDRRDELGDLARSFDEMRNKVTVSSVLMEQRNHELGILNELALAASQMQDVHQILDLALDTIVNKMSMDAGQVFLIDDKTNALESVATRGLSDSIWRRARQSQMQVKQRYTERAFRTGETTYVPEIGADPSFVGIFEHGQSRSFLCIPLKTRGVVVGAITLVSHPGTRIPQDQVAVFNRIGLEVGVAVDNALLLAKTRRNERAATALYEIGKQISGSLDLDQVMNSVAAGAQHGLGAEVGVAGLFAEERHGIVLQAASGTVTATWREAILSLEDGTPGHGLISNGPLIVQEYSPAGSIPAFDEWLTEEKLISFVAVPLWLKDSLVGIIGIGFRVRHSFSNEDLDFLTRLTPQAATAVENARLHQQVRNMAVLEERDRLAREMHDNVAQSLAYIHFKSAVTQEMLSSGRTREAHASLVELEKAAMDAHTDVREQIFGLRATALLQLGFVPALRDYAKEYQSRYGVNARIVCDDEAPPELDPAVTIHLLRIVQEALTNCRKHAHASEVTVTIWSDSDLCVRIEDDGIGFDPEAGAHSQPHFGLQIMRERAESVGASLRIDSQPGNGTRIWIRVPLEQKG